MKERMNDTAEFQFPVFTYNVIHQTEKLKGGGKAAN